MKRRAFIPLGCIALVKVIIFALAMLVATPLNRAQAGSCLASCVCGPSSVYCTGKCQRDNCASDECKAVEAALDNLKGAAYLELQNAFNDGHIEITSGSQTLSEFLDSKSATYNALAQMVATKQCGKASETLGVDADLYCETLTYCGYDMDPPGPSIIANSNTMKPPVIEYGNTRPNVRFSIVSETCNYSCEACDKVVQVTASVVDLIITDMRAAFYGGTLSVSTSYLDSYISKMCSAITEINNDQGCGAATSSTYCAPPVAADGADLHSPLWPLWFTYHALFTKGLP